MKDLLERALNFAKSREWTTEHDDYHPYCPDCGGWSANCSGCNHTAGHKADCESAKLIAELEQAVED